MPDEADRDVIPNDTSNSQVTQEHSAATRLWRLFTKTHEAKVAAITAASIVRSPQTPRPTRPLLCFPTGRRRITWNH